MNTQNISSTSFRFFSLLGGVITPPFSALRRGICIADIRPGICCCRLKRHARRITVSSVILWAVFGYVRREMQTVSTNRSGAAAYICLLLNIRIGVYEYTHYLSIRQILRNAISLHYILRLLTVRARITAPDRKSFQICFPDTERFFLLISSSVSTLILCSETPRR